MPPATVDGVDESGVGKSEGTVTVRVDAVLDENGEVLITTEMRCPDTADFTEGFVSPGLWPSVAVEISEESVVGTAMNMNRTTESGL
jgi:hypothetical protein